MKHVLMAVVIACILFATGCGSKDLYIYDMTKLWSLDISKPEQAREAWDTAHFVSTLQGIVNQKQPTLYVYFNGYNNETDPQGGADKFWLGKMTEKGAWLSSYRQNEIADIDELVKTFRSSINGLVVYDENVPATSCAATTCAGVNGMPAVRFDKSRTSLYYHLTQDPKGPKLPVKVWLVKPDGSSMFTGNGTIPDTKLSSTGSAKCDVYLWAKEKYLDSGKCDPHVLGYYLDCSWVKNPGGRLSNFTLTNHDYIVAKKGFCFDLSPWDDEPATDDPGQPLGADTMTLKAILQSAYDQNKGKMIQAAGFLPWDRKYTQHAGGKHGDVEGEWKYAEILSCYNAYMDADALGYSAMANASVFSLFPLKAKYPQKKPGIEDLKKAGYILEDGSVKKAVYVTYYVGDYDAAAWMYQRMPEIWESPDRGSVPLGWAFNPNLAERFAFGMHYIRSTATENDYFVTGDVGAGYINPGHLVEPRKYSGMPSGVKAWEEHCKKWMNRFDLSIVGFVIDGFAPAMNEELLDMYSRIAPDGIGGQKLPARNGLFNNKMPYIIMQSDVYDPEADAKTHAAYMGKNMPEFYMFRNILWPVANQKLFYDTLRKNVKGDVELLSPYHFFLLMKYEMQRANAGGAASGNKFDFRNITVTGNSPVNQISSINDMFGANESAVEPGVTIFADGPEDKYVEWETKTEAEISSVTLATRPDGNERKRHTPHFALYTKSGKNGDWTEIISRDIGFPPEPGYTFDLPKPVKAKYFKAVFAADKEGEFGARIVELSAE
ncbi:MAG: hypothetical protein IJT95_04475 [Abditibacteriota bacterium]|nr:hypothetical protein [Abditibacteriota bacterium]